ncbi:putative methyltransferase domain-containing protein [Phaeomoniella chlamydospora]|uniref:Putative methyltransferase domain-containing protein n=1 Tax=Phaeomoniella chlamydospora TaxID=158046 RepID=A0A0G2E6V0_PHACM|nr:putative methyltransferase domain-containing protein [Phaeomoniella chlamydospora]
MKSPTALSSLARTASHRRTVFHPWRGRRSYAVQAPGAPAFEVFNHKAKLLQKERAAQNLEESRNVEYLRDEVAQRLCDRLLDIKRTFPSVLDLGSHSGNVARAVLSPNVPAPEHADESQPPPVQPLHTRMEHLTMAEASPSMLYRDDLGDSANPHSSSLQITRQPLYAYETPLPFPPNTFDAVLSSLTLHWINDLPTMLSQINQVLKPDSPFIGAMLGGDSLYELRSSLQLADLERRGGVTPHVSPLADVRDVGNLLTRASFKLLTVDVDDIVVEYPDTFALMKDLQAMGEGNAVMTRKGAGLGGLSRDVLIANDAIYREMYGAESDEDQGSLDGREGDGLPVERQGIPATFRIIYMIGWKEGEGQSQPLERGSGNVNLKDILGGGDFGR